MGPLLRLNAIIDNCQNRTNQTQKRAVVINNSAPPGCLKRLPSAMGSESDDEDYQEPGKKTPCKPPTVTNPARTILSAFRLAAEKAGTSINITAENKGAY